MQCRVCGSTDNMATYSNQRVSMCSVCVNETPRKMGRTEFDRTYWGIGFEKVSDGIRREFYSDYLVSVLSFGEYLDTTTEIN